MNLVLVILLGMGGATIGQHLVWAVILSYLQIVFICCGQHSHVAMVIPEFIACVLGGGVVVAASANFFLYRSDSQEDIFVHQVSSSFMDSY